jgi:hypothetical protein
MTYHLLADLVFVLHLAFICFVIGGGVLVWRRHWLAIPHLTAVCWGLAIEFLNAPCPLTPLEQALLHKAGAEGYYGGFVEHYIVPLIYPEADAHFFLKAGVFVLVINLILYGLLIVRVRAGRYKRK